MRLVPRDWHTETWICSIRGHQTPAARVLELRPEDRSLGIELESPPHDRLARCLRCDVWLEVPQPDAGAPVDAGTLEPDAGLETDAGAPAPQGGGTAPELLGPQQLRQTGCGCAQVELSSVREVEINLPT